MKRTLVLFLFSLCYFKSWSWGAKGHIIVAGFAKEALLSMDKRIVDSVGYFLGHMSFEKTALWMDEIKSETKEYNEWHYINIEKDKTYVKVKEFNIVNQLEWAIGELEKKETRDVSKINFALKVLFHLIGDIHQPLHSGYGEDKGGNEVVVDYFGEEVKLHALWDYNIIDHEKISLKNCLEMANTIPVKEQAEIQQIGVVKWMEESRALLPFVYNFENGKITPEYSAKAKLIIEKQLVKAGIRLTAVLFRTFRKPAK